MTETKSLWASGAVWGGILAALSGVAQVVTVLTDPDTARMLSDAVTGLGAFLGGCLAIIRRIQATARLV